MVVDDEKVEGLDDDSTGQIADEAADGVEDEKEEGAASDGTAGKGLVNDASAKRLSMSLLAALIWLILGQILPLLSAILFKSLFYPLFVSAPLLILLFNSLLKGRRDTPAVIVTAAFSLVSACLSVWSCAAVLYASRSQVTVSQILSAMVRQSALPTSASAYAYPLVFTALGVVIVAVSYRSPADRRGSELEDMAAEDVENAEGEV